MCNDNQLLQIVNKAGRAYQYHLQWLREGERIFQEGPRLRFLPPKERINCRCAPFNTRATKKILPRDIPSW